MRVRYDAGDGPPVVLLHGQPGSASDWVRVVPLLRDAGLRVLAPDRPGYAGSRRPPSDWTTNARLLLQRLDERGLDRATLVGWSWGGAVALEAARLAPDRVPALVLVASLGHTRAVGAADRVLALPLLQRAGRPLLERFAARGTALLEETSGSRLDAEARRYFAAEVALWPATGAWRAAAYEQTAMVRDAPTLQAGLSLVTAPTTVLHGWRDRYVSVQAAAALAAALPRAALVPVDGGHLLPFERPRDVAAAVVAAARG